VKAIRLRPGAHIHFVGIGGAGLSAIARVLLEEGYTVSGSDVATNALTDALALLGARIYQGHRAGNVGRADAVVISSAVRPDNPEMEAAQAQGIPVVKRADFLGELMAGRIGICVAGTHGKTTTTGMIALILMEAGQDPTFVLGGVLNELGTNARAGQGKPFVIEADEYDRMFLGLKPTIAVVTNIEHDHPDIYPTLDDVKAAFHEFTNLVPAEGLLVACWDDPGARELGLLHAKWGRVAFYGLGEGAAWRALDIRPNQAGGSDFLVERDGEMLGLVRLRVPGLHNVRNALAALAVAAEMGVPFPVARDALTGFHGMGRRFEVIGEAGGVTVVDDYAHHPTEVRATLAAARQRYPQATIWAVFQPHTFTRTRALLEDFARSFDDADHVIVTDIYAAREQPILGITAKDLVARMKHRSARHIPTLAQVTDELARRVRPGDVVITLSAGDANQVGRWLLERLQGNNRLPPLHLTILEAMERVFQEVFEDRFAKNEPLARYTSARIGGPAEYFVNAQNVEDLVRAVKLARAHRLPYLILGGGSNVLVSDRGVHGLVILNRAKGVQFRHSGAWVTLRAESGATLSMLARQCVSRGLAGLEWAVNVPGTVGGAVFGNAGAHGGDIAGCLRTATILDPDGRIHTWMVDDLQYEYRNSLLARELRAGKEPRVVLAAEFALTPQPVDALEARVNAFVEHRKRTQPPGASIGSMFKNPPGDYAGRLIDAAGLKGTRIGDAEISPVHANFFINHGQARASDVKALIDLARTRVRELFSVELELEIWLVGEW